MNDSIAIIKQYLNKLRKKILISSDNLIDDSRQINSNLVKELLEHLGNNESSIRKLIIKTLKEIGDNSAIQPLLNRFIVEQSPQIKGLIAWALGFFRYDTFNMDSLIDALEIYNSYLRKNIIVALGNNRYKDSTSKIVKILQEDDRVEIRRIAVWALGQIECAETLEPLIDSLRDPSFKVRIEISEVLSKFPYTKNKADSIQQILDDSQHPGKINAIYILGRIKWKDAVPKLIEIIGNNEDINLRKQAIRAIKIIRDHRALGVLEAAIDDTSEIIRRETIEALVYYPKITMDIIKKIANRIYDDVAEVRLVAIRFMKSIMGSCFIPLEITNNYPKLFEMLENDPDEEIKAAICSLFICIDDMSIVSALRKAALTDKSEYVRVCASGALCAYKDDEIIERLILMLSSPSKKVRCNAINNLYRTDKIEKYYNTFLSLFKDKNKDYRERIQALYLMSECINKTFFDDLQEILEIESNPEIRYHIIYQFGDKNDFNTIKLLKKAQKDPSVKVRELADSILEYINSTKRESPFFYYRKKTPIFPKSRYLTIPEEDKADKNKLIQLVKNNGNREIRKEAVKMLSKFPIEDKILDAIFTAIKDKDSIVRIVAAYTLRKINDPKRAKYLIEALNDPSKKVRNIATRNLLFCPEIYTHEQTLIDALKDDQHLNKEIIISYLNKISSNKSVPYLLKILNTDINSEIRAKATDAFMLSFDERAVEPLIKALKDPDSKVRRTVRKVLSQDKYKDYILQKNLEIEIEKTNKQEVKDEILYRANYQKPDIDELRARLYHPIWEVRREAYMLLSFHSKKDIPEDYNLVSEVKLKFE
ncbi:MAG: HEAT repeat domain-containing protein [Candidatus Heimdallarchaeota archaeon]|nr:HEAT repeat domain-containing protein [Candidatus Heimdallarchaeota archaeon]